MGSIVAAPKTIIEEIWANASKRIEESSTLEGAAQNLLGAVYGEFGDALALARVFVTIPYGDLPEPNQE